MTSTETSRVSCPSRSGVPFRLGLIAPKNTPEMQRSLLGFLADVLAEPYIRGRRYDLVWFLNVTPEIRWLKANTDAKCYVIAMEPKFMYPANYDPELLRLADFYLGYRNFAGDGFRGRFEPYTFPVYPRADIVREFPVSLASQRPLDFCFFAKHDPNIRRDIGAQLKHHRAILAGPLFGNPVTNKLSVQRQCHYEFITENDINDYYLSEKLGAALVGGCVPVYYGCTRAKNMVPADLFIDLHDFEDATGHCDIARAIEHCLAPGVYERYSAALRQKALPLLLDRFTIERCLIEPLQHFIDDLRAAQWNAGDGSFRWKYWALRRQIKRLVKP